MEILLILEICFVSSEQIERDMKKFEEIQNFSVLQINISNISPIKMKKIPHPLKISIVLRFCLQHKQCNRERLKLS